MTDALRTAASRAALILAVAGLAACGGPETNATTAPDAAATASEDGDAAHGGGFTFSDEVYPAPDSGARSEAFLAANGAREGVLSTESGLQYEVITRGDGEGSEGDWPADETLTLMIDYEGSFIDGLQFDGSQNGEPLDIEFGLLQFEGLKEGLKLMHEGDRYRFFIPADLAFGEAGTPGGPVRPNEALVYEVTLVDVVTPAEAEAAEAAAEAAEAERVAAIEGAAQASVDFIEEMKGQEGVTATESGLLYQVLEEGPADGASPTAEDTVRVHYRGTLPDGTEFDSSYARGEPATFPLNGVIPGWTEGVQLMSVGDTFKFYLPSDLAYGERGAGANIGPNQALVFEVELLGVNPDAGE